MKRVALWLEHYYEPLLLIIILSATSIIVFAQVVARYVFDDAFYWSEEISRYLFIWLIYIALSYAVKTDKHIRMDSLVSLNILSDTGKKIVVFIADLIFLVFSLFIAYYGTQVLLVTVRRGQTMPSTELPMWLVYAAVPLGYFICSFRLVQRVVYKIRHFGSDYATFSKPLATVSLSRPDSNKAVDKEVSA